MKKSNTLCLAIFLILTSYGMLSLAQKNGNASYNFDIQCMGTGMDGTQLVKVWGFGKNPNVAIEQAKKNAVYAVIFKGITTGEPGCMNRPLLTASGSEQQFGDYFNAFFADGGKYLDYVNISSDGSIDPNDRIKVGRQYNMGVIVSVSHTQLRKDLETAGIVKKLTDGF